MSHPFEVGKTYRNRVGEYVVQAIEGDWIKIRYVGGGTLETRVSIQARIWENIQFEEQMAREEERQRLAREARMASRKRTARARRVRAKPQFTGFEESDFEPKKRGIAWSGRKELGKFLAYELGRRTKGDFGMWIVPRQSEVHVARKGHYSRDTRETNAALFVAVNEKGVAYGFRVGKPEGKVKAQWPWSALVAALADDEEVQGTLRAVMEQHDLKLDVYAEEASYGQIGQVVVQEKGFLWQHETADQEISRGMTQEELAGYLQAELASKRCDLFLRKRLSASEALKADAGASGEIADVSAALLPLFDVSVGA